MMCRCSKTRRPWQLDNNAVNNICRSIRRDSNQPGTEPATTRLKLLAFYNIKHQDQTTRVFGVIAKPLVRTTLMRINSLTIQKCLEDTWASENKEPDYIAITLDTFSATKAFEKVKTILTRVCGATDVPLAYVVQHQLIPEDEDDDPPFGEEETKYTSIGQEMTAHAPILTDDANYNAKYETLKTNGPFASSFLTDWKKVWTILHACFGISSTWQHVKKLTAQKNGHKDHFFRGDKVNTMCSNILLTLKSLHYSGNCKNFNFNKYCAAHLEQHD
jgi:hypothetical protein